MGRKLIIDIESYIYRACVASQTLTDNGQGIYTECYDLNKSMEYIKEFIDKLIINLKAVDYVVTLGSSKNFRKVINPKYKSNRKDVPRHPMLGIVTDAVAECYKTIYIPYLEADDVCRIIYEEDRINNIIVSIDKDLSSFPCRLYNPNHEEKWIQDISTVRASGNFYKQLIMGDSCDGYKGLTGYGEARANKLVENGIGIQDILDLYLSNGQTEEDFINVFNMATIIGKDNYSNNIIKLYNTKFNTVTERITK